MGQKINPVLFRVGEFLPWKSRWFFDDKKYKDFLVEDIRIRKMLMEDLKVAGIDRVEIERLQKSMVITLVVSRPGVVIGRGGSGLEAIKAKVLKKMKTNLKIDLKVQEIREPEL